RRGAEYNGGSARPRALGGLGCLLCVLLRFFLCGLRLRRGGARRIRGGRRRRSGRLALRFLFPPTARVEIGVPATALQHEGGGGDQPLGFRGLALRTGLDRVLCDPLLALELVAALLALVLV